MSLTTNVYSKMKKQLPLLLLLALIGAFVFSLEGCGDDPNPCKDKLPISADFIIGEQLLSIDTLIESDTVLTGGTITFKSKGDYQSYEWKIGDDPRVFTTRSVSLFFEKSDFSKTLSIKLKVKDSFLASCFPNKGGVDSLTKRIVLLPSYASATFGQYEGSLDEDPTNKYIITVRFCQPGVNGFICTNNIDKGCDNKLYTSDPYPYINDFDLTYRVMRIGSPTSTNYLNAASGHPLNCNDPRGWLYFKNSLNSVIVEYTTGDYTNQKLPRKKHRFTGKRI
jgi:hypothetical protein